MSRIKTKNKGLERIISEINFLISLIILLMFNTIFVITHII